MIIFDFRFRKGHFIKDRVNKLMSTKFILIFIMICFITGCGKAEKTENDTAGTVGVSEQTETEENQIMLQQQETEQYYEYEEEDENVVHTPRPINYGSNIAKDISKLELCTIEREAYKKDENAYRKAVLFDEFEIKLKQKEFASKIIIKDTDMKDIYNQYDVTEEMPDEEYFHNNYIDKYIRYGDSGNPEIQFYIHNYLKSDYEEDYTIEGEEVKYEVIFYKKDIQTGVLCKSIVLSDRSWDKNTGEEGESFGTNLTTYGDIVAVVDEYEERKICILNMKENTYEVVDFKNMVINEYGLCKANMEYRDDKKYDELVLLDLTFVNENKLAVKTSFDHVFIYDIAQSEITDSIKLRGYKWKQFDLKKGVCNLSREAKDGTMEFFSIDLDNMQIVSYVKTSIDDFKSCKFEYRDGISYFINNSKGLYAYNPKTKGFDTIYADFQKETEYTDEIIKRKNKSLRDYEQIHSEVVTMFADEKIYLLHGIYGIIEHEEYGEIKGCLERKYKKIILK